LPFPPAERAQRGELARVAARLVRASTVPTKLAARIDARPASQWTRAAGLAVGPRATAFGSTRAQRQLPAKAADIAFAPCGSSRAGSKSPSHVERLTQLYL